MGQYARNVAALTLVLASAAGHARAQLLDFYIWSVYAPPEALPRVLDASAGYAFNVAIRPDRSLLGWGPANSWGQQGKIPTGGVQAPCIVTPSACWMPLGGIPPLARVAGGWDHCIALAADLNYTSEPGWHRACDGLACRSR